MLRRRRRPPFRYQARRPPVRRPRTCPWPRQRHLPSPPLTGRRPPRPEPAGLPLLLALPPHPIRRRLTTLRRLHQRLLPRVLIRQRLRHRPQRQLRCRQPSRHRQPSSPPRRRQPPPGLQRLLRPHAPRCRTQGCSDCEAPCRLARPRPARPHAPPRRSAQRPRRVRRPRRAPRPPKPGLQPKPAPQPSSALRSNRGPQPKAALPPTSEQPMPADRGAQPTAQWGRHRPAPLLRRLLRRPPPQRHRRALRLRPRRAAPTTAPPQPTRPSQRRRPPRRCRPCHRLRRPRRRPPADLARSQQPARPRPGALRPTAAAR